jgi:hypothetical protein
MAKTVIKRYTREKFYSALYSYRISWTDSCSRNTGHALNHYATSLARLFTQFLSCKDRKWKYLILVQLPQYIYWPFAIESRSTAAVLQGLYSCRPCTGFATIYVKTYHKYWVLKICHNLCVHVSEILSSQDLPQFMYPHMLKRITNTEFSGFATIYVSAYVKTYQEYWVLRICHNLCIRIC